MTRRLQLAVATAAVAAFAGAAAGQAATGQQVFAGTLEEQHDATVRMKTGATDEFHVKVFTVHDFRVDCGDGDGIAERGTLKGRIPIGDRGRFHARNKDNKSVINVRGKIDGRKAEGVFRFSGELKDRDGTTQDCESGQLHWTARAAAS